MMANNYYYGNGFTSAAPQKVVMNQMLSKEEIAKLKSKNKSWSLQLTEDEVLTEMCSHKDPDTGDISIVDNHDGTVTCSICGETFSLVNDLTEEEVQNICDDFNDVWQTSKTNYGSMPIQAGRAFYKMGALAKKVPQFYKLGQESRKQWNHNTMVEANRGANAFAQLSMLLNPMAGGYGAPMGYPGMAPGMAPQAAPMGYPAAPGMAPQAPMGYPAAPGMTPVAPGAAAPAAAPQGYAGAPVAGPAPQSFNPTGAPVAPAAGTDRPVGIVEPAATTADVAKGFKA